MNTKEILELAIALKATDKNDKSFYLYVKEIKWQLNELEESSNKSDYDKAAELIHLQRDYIELEKRLRSAISAIEILRITENLEALEAKINQLHQALFEEKSK